MYTKSYRISIDSANMTYKIAKWFLIISAFLLGSGIAGYFKMLDSIKKDAERKADKKVDRVIKKTQQQVDEAIERTEVSFYRKLSDLDFVPGILQREFNRILDDSEKYKHLSNLQSSQDEQAKAIAYFVVNPAKGDPVVMSALEKLAEEDNPYLRAQSMFARYACGDQTALDELRALLGDEAMREAAEEALGEMRERFPEVASLLNSG